MSGEGNMFNIKFLKIQIICVFTLQVFTLLIVNTIQANLVDYQNQMQLNNMFYLSSTTTWLEFALNSTMPQMQDKKWAWIGLITFKIKIPMMLEKLNLHWHGATIQNLQASLYQKREMDPNLVPVEKNLVCDGVWNPQAQELSFNVNQKVVSINNYYLFLSFPTHDEQSIKKGHFSLPEKAAIQLTKLD
jgi:hypothetical protein